MRLTALFQQYTPAGGWVLVDPDVEGSGDDATYNLSGLTRPEDGGTSLEAFSTCHVIAAGADSIKRKATGVFYVSVNPDKYTDLTWYEYQFTAVIGGRTIQSERPWYFEAAGASPEPSTTAAFYRVVAVRRHSSGKTKTLTVERLDKPVFPR